MAMGGLLISQKGNGNGQHRPRPCGLVLLLAFGVAMLAILALHKLRERRIFQPPPPREQPSPHFPSAPAAGLPAFLSYITHIFCFEGSTCCVVFFITETNRIHQTTERES